MGVVTIKQFRNILAGLIALFEAALPENASVRTELAVPRMLEGWNPLHVGGACFEKGG